MFRFNKNIFIKDRESLVKYFIVCALIIVIFRLFHIQVLNNSRYIASAREQQVKENKIEAKRGGILTQDNYQLVTTVTKYKVWLDSKNVEEFNSQKKNIGNYLPLDSAVFTGDKKYYYLSDVDVEGRDKLNQYRWLSFDPYTLRSYPEKNMLSHVLGIVRKDANGKSVGYYGVEEYYNGDLTGQDGEYIQFKGADGRPILHAGFERLLAKDGSDLILTINRDIQFMVEQKLEAGVKKYAAKSGTVIVVDPKSGEIISLSNYPTFDPNKFGNGEELRNRAISTVYEPGSVMKAITMATGIDLGKVSLQSTYNDTSAKYFSGHKVDNWDGKHHGLETMVSILQHSNNLGTAWVGQQIGSKSLIEYFNSFGFGKKSGIDLVGEEAGLIYNSDNLKDIELVNSSFGQGIAVTPLQMTMAYAAIANDGKLMQPYIVKKIVGKFAVSENSSKVVGRPISAKTASTVVNMLKEAVSGGEAKYFVSKKFDISGKTGTAQIAVKGGYDATRTNATFVGFFTNTRNFVMFVKLEEPRSPSGYAAETAVPLWMDIAEHLAVYNNIMPDKNVYNK